MTKQEMFDKFIEINNLYDDLYAQNNYITIRNHFLEADFDEETKTRLTEYLVEMKKVISKNRI